MKAIGIDIGTTSICGVLVDTQSGEIIKSVTKNSEAFIKTSNEWEKIQDTQKIINMAVDITDSLICDDCACIGITGQMHGIVYYDKDGSAVSSLYTWQDGRGNQIYKDGNTYSNYLGIPTGYGYVTDFYNCDKGIKPQNAVGYCTIHDYLGMVLTGRKKALLHSSDAASYGDYNLDSNTFNHEFYGDITSEFALLGEYKGIPVSVAIGDNQASVFGALSCDDDILLNIGTGSQISVVSDKPIIGENIESRPYTDGKFLIVGAALCGGRAYSMLEKFYSDIVYAATGTRMSMYEVMNNMTASSQTPIIADTRFSGTRSNPDLKGGLFDITTENLTPGDVKCAFLNGIIKELYDMYVSMNVSRSSLIGSGNGIRKNKALRQTCENMFGAKMKTPLHLEEAAFGAALFAMTAVGFENVKNIIRYEV